ncbi:MFS transporter [Rubeoparvulum massiliense]|uniref:MFS transporter n=1 Tax=Rubeoparvulum massiliense TaxID=1631346 RepID=UPI00069DD428|nr:MFS transporter [Rubeoparvulum massiliense]
MSAQTKSNQKNQSNKQKNNQNGGTPNGWVITALASVPFIMVLGNSMLIPILPTLKKVMDLSQVQSSLIITLFSVPAGLVIPFAGILSDRIGRKKVIIPSLILYGAGGLVAGIALMIKASSAFPWVMTGRVIQGIGAAGTAPIAMALVSDMFIKRERSKVLGLIEASNGMGKVVSPILGSALALLTYLSLFFVFPALTVLIIILFAWAIKEPENKQEPPPFRQYWRSIVEIFKNQWKWLIVAFLAGAITLFILFGVLFYLSDLLEKKYKIDGIIKGLILAIPLLAMVTSSYLTGRLIKQKITLMKWLIVIGLLVLGCVNIFFPFTTNRVLFISVLAVGGLASGLILPCLNMLITSSVDSEERGIITSLYGSVRFLAVAAGPPFFSALMDNKKLLFWSIGATSIVIGLAAWWLIKPDRIKRALEEKS